MPCQTCGQRVVRTKGCSGCNQRWLRQTKLGSGSVVRSAQSARAVAPQNDPSLVLVTYNGPAGNHYILSPSRLVKNYGYGGKGVRIRVHAEDVRAAADKFIPVSIEEAQKVWSAYPDGVPQWLIDRLQVPA